MGYSLGVDLGTTFVAAAIATATRVEMFTLGDRSVVTPAVVYLREDGVLVTGETAVLRAVSSPDRVSREFKRRLGNPTPVILGGQPYTVTALLGALLGDVVDKVVETEGEPPERILLTHPANWGPFRRALFEEVLQHAGLHSPLLVTEPEATAAHYAASRQLNDGQTVAVYDLGGATFNATILRKLPRGVEILGTPEGIERLGGVDFDEAILSYVDYAADGALNKLDLRDPQTRVVMARLRQDCVLAKEALSVGTETVIPVFLPQRHFDVRITRTDFEDMVRPAIESTIGTLSRTLASAQVQPRDLSAVLLIGGSSRIPLVARMVSAELGRVTVVDTHPKYAVALGAATLADESATVSMRPADLFSSTRDQQIVAGARTPTASTRDKAIVPPRPPATETVQRAGPVPRQGGWIPAGDQPQPGPMPLPSPAPSTDTARGLPRRSARRQAESGSVAQPSPPPVLSVSTRSSSGWFRRTLQRFRRSEAGSGPAGATSVTGDQPPRFLQARSPTVVCPGGRVGVQARIAQDAGIARSSRLLSSFRVPREGAEVLLLLHAPAFVALTPPRQRVHVPPEGDSDWVLFDLEATSQMAAHVVTITAFRGGTQIGELHLDLTIDLDAEVADAVERSESLPSISGYDGDLTLVITQAGGLYRFLLVAKDYVSNEIVLDRPLQPARAVEGLLTQLNIAARGQAPWPPEVMRRWLRGKGKELWQDLVPAQLQREFWEHRDQIRQLTLSSDGDPLPWELLYPVDALGNDAGFLAEQFPVVRWVRGRPAPYSLHTNRVSLVTAGEGLASAQAEIANLRKFFIGAMSREPIVALADLLDCLERADFHILHFAAHNVFNADQPDISGISLGLQSFVPTFVTDLAVRRPLAATNPLVFMNACRTAGESTLYTGMYGWARAFLAAGAGAFIGTLWEARDSTARLFAEEFYRQARQPGITLGMAVSSAREAVKDEPGDPTWLAYSVYGNARATFTGL